MSSDSPTQINLMNLGLHKPLLTLKIRSMCPILYVSFIGAKVFEESDEYLYYGCQSKDFKKEVNVWYFLGFAGMQDAWAG